MSVPSFDPRIPVKRQLDAYNAKDIEAFMEAWTDDAEIFEHPSTLLARGRDAIRARHEERFREPFLYGRLISRTCVGSTVVDHEEVTRSFPEGRGRVEVIAIYSVVGERIRTAWFVVGPRTIDESRIP